MFNKLFGLKDKKNRITEIYSDDDDSSDDSSHNSSHDSSDDESEKNKKVATPTKQVVDNGPKCGVNKHLKSADLFCKECKCTVCSKCLSAHKNHPVADYEEIFEEIVKESKNFSSQLRNGMEEKLKEKDSNTQLFQEKVQVHYDTQVDTISNYFRELHDSLHIREVELKRELKSYHDENCETITTLVSKIEGDVEKSKTFLKEIETLKINEEEPEKNLQLILNYYDTLDCINNKTTISNEINIYTFTEAPNTQKMISGSIKLNKRRFQSPFSSKKAPTVDQSVIYVYSKDGVERYDTRTNTKSTVIASGAPNSPPLLSYFWHYSVIDGKIYMFDRDKYWVLDCSAEKPAWREGAFPANNSSSVSTMYDGADHIYVLGGYPLGGGEQVKEIYKFNIKDETFVRVGSKIITSSYLTLAYHQDIIYLIGGYNTTNSWLNRIDKFDCKTYATENICIVNDTSILINSGTYVPSINAFFVFTWTANFHKYDPETGQYTKLAKPASSPNYAKLFWDGDNTIFLYVERDVNCHHYDIKNNTFTAVPHNLSTEIASSSFFAMSSN